MKASGFILGVVITADQRRSRERPDAVPDALTALALIPGFQLAWERTAGDEIQAFTTDPTAVIGAVECLVRLGCWQLGLGIGAVDAPLPSSTRAGRGQAYVDARAAVERAKRTPVRAAAAGREAADIEAALWMLCAVLERRTPQGWEVASLRDEGLSQADVADRLGVSDSAVSQRATRAALDVTDAGRALLGRMIGRAIGHAV